MEVINLFQLQREINHKLYKAINAETDYYSEQAIEERQLRSYERYLKSDERKERMRKRQERYDEWIREQTRLNPNFVPPDPDFDGYTPIFEKK